MTKREVVYVLDFGSQYTQLIARRVRELKVYCEILPFNTSASRLRELQPQGIILSGGPSSVYQKQAPIPDKGIFSLGIPVLGICYGMQLMGYLLGGRVDSSTKREYGHAWLSHSSSSDLFKGLPKKITVWMSHGDKVVKLPQGFEPVASTHNSAFSAMQDKQKRIFGLQFHPEVVHTPQGKEILRNFLYRVCGCQGTWNMKSFVKETIKQVREKIGKERVLCALSGGVDSSVTAVLLHKAVGRQLTCVFVNNGVLRKDEAERVQKVFAGHFKMRLVYADATRSFLGKLKGVLDPEKKRKIIGAEFISVFEKEAKKLGKIPYLAQGTLYPDVIESVSVKGPSATIKSHHNVGGLPEKMKFKLVEPLRELFKDEVRAVGREMGVSEDIVGRQPFPGPGLAIRVLGEVTEERLKILREADWVVIDEIKAAGLYHKIWQSFAVLLPVKTVGVMGDERTYDNVIALRAVNSMDGMTADWVNLPYPLLGKISNRIINEVKGVNRVVYDISSKPPSTIEWE